MSTIGASEAPSLVGVGYVSAQELWRQKMGISEREPLHQEYAEMGKRLENAALAWFYAQEWRLGQLERSPDLPVPDHWAVVPGGSHGGLTVQREEALPFRATPDAWTMDADGIVLIEVKGSKSPLKVEPPLKISRRYWVQLQVQMLVCKVSRGLLVHVHEHVGEVSGQPQWLISQTKVGANAQFMRYIHSKAVEFVGFLERGKEIPRGWAKWPEEVFDAQSG